jgi:carbohydrate binding protein with CBM6 domain
MVVPGVYATRIDHFAVLRTIEDMYGLGHAGAAATAAPITVGWTTSVPGASTLTAQPGDGRVALSWTAVAGALGYTVSRGTASNGETPLTSGLAGTGYLDTAVANGTTYYYQITAVNVNGDGVPSNEANAMPNAAAAPRSASPFGGTPAPIPGTIEAENFDDGGASVAYVDTTPGNRGGAYRQTDVDIESTADAGGGYDVGWTRPGEWLQYTADATATGIYALELRVASASTGGTLRLEVDGVDVTGTLIVPNTGGWQTWQTMRTEGIVLRAGRRRIRLVFVDAGTNGIANVNFLRLVP